LLTTDNTLSLRLEGRCAACDRVGAPWVTVDPASRLETSGTKLTLANDLALLPIPFFDPASGRAWRLPVAFSGPPDPDEVKAAAIAASWFGVASDFRGVRFPVTIGDLPEGNALVIARRGSAIESALSLPSQPATLVAVRDNPRDPYGKLLILVGDGPAELLSAARALVTYDLSPRHADAVPVQDVRVPLRNQYDAPRWITGDRPAPIGQYTSADRLKLLGSGSITLYFRLPPDLFLAARQSVPLLLRFEYAGVADRSRAALHVRLNEKDVDSIRLEPTLAPVRRQEIVRIPTGSLRPYTNTLTVDVDFAQRGELGGVSQYAAIERDSSIDVRGIPHSVVLPRLELVVESGYPFTQWPDLSRTAVVLSNAPTATEYETLLNLVGFCGAQTGWPVTAITVIDAAHIEDARDKDLLLLGAPLSQPLLPSWADRMPLGLTTTALRLNDLPGPFPRLDSYWPFHNDNRDRLVGIIANGARFDAIVEHFVSPLRPDRSVVALVPGDTEGGEIVTSLFTGPSRGPVYGDVAMAHDGRFESFPVRAASYHAGRLDALQRGRVMLIEHYRIAPLLVVLLALAIGSALRDGVERVAARRLMVEDDDRAPTEGWSL
jgi:cellulose synthase (UDP-forming)